jgi:hypothetical protein
MLKCRTQSGGLGEAPIEEERIRHMKRLFFYQRVAFEMHKDSALTLGMHVVVNVVNTRILLQFIFHSLPFATFVFSPWHF